MPEWSKGDDLSSSIERCVGSNPTSSNLCCLFSLSKQLLNVMLLGDPNTKRNN